MTLANNPTMDPESVALCDAINSVPGLFTTESCCGHGKHPFKIFFKVRRLSALPWLLYWADG